MKIKKLLLSALALVNVVFVPVFDVWGGLFPSNPDNNFFDVIEYVLEGELNYWVVQFTLAMFIPSMFMFVFSFLESNKMFKLSAGAGVVSMILTLILFVTESDFNELFDFDDGNISIGTWVGLILFIVSLLVVKNNNKKHIDSISDENNSIIDVKIQTTNFVQPNNFCSKCGTEMQVSSNFCGNCGYKMKE